jgi:hypothetical protein
MIEELLDRSSWGTILLARLSEGDLGTILLVLAIIAFAAAVWRATLRDVLGTVLCAGLGLVLLIVAL